MSNLQRYTLEDFDGYIEIVIEVNTGIMTEEIAHEINGFFYNAETRLRQEKGDIYKAVVRLAAGFAVAMAIREGGWCFGADSEGAAICSKQLRAEEGFGGEADDGNPFGFIGLRIVRADINPEFDLEFK
ncbi:MAG: DUF2528 family protein [Sweet potato little leaf phytoplasma]|nr:DUF2528 family protein [Sweet potato little leaf phytoplasma]